MINQDLINAYLKTIYRITTDYEQIDVIINEPAIALEQYLIFQSKTSAAIITAYNPFSKQTSIKTNIDVQKQLMNDIVEMNLDFFETFNISPDDRWADEPSYCVLGINLTDAIQLGTKYKQNAIVFIQIDQVAELMYCI